MRQRLEHHAAVGRPFHPVGEADFLLLAGRVVKGPAHDAALVGHQLLRRRGGDGQLLDDNGGVFGDRNLVDDGDPDRKIMQVLDHRLEVARLGLGVAEPARLVFLAADRYARDLDAVIRAKAKISAVAGRDQGEMADAGKRAVAVDGDITGQQRRILVIDEAGLQIGCLLKRGAGLDREGRADTARGDAEAFLRTVGRNADAARNLE